MNLQIYRGKDKHIEVPIDENTIFRQVVMGEHVINCSFISPEPIDIEEGDYVMFRGERFTLNRPFPAVEKSSNFTYKYDLVFEGYTYDLLDMPIMHLGALEFSYYGTPKAFLEIIVNCMNEVSEGWVVGEVEDVDEKLIDFYESSKGFSCKGALIKIAETFELEFWLTGKTINLKKQAGVETGLFFEYGRSNGLYKVTRGKIDDQAYFNRLYIQGSDKNIPDTYKNGAKRLKLDEPFLQADIPEGKKIRAASVVIDDIYPHRTGVVGSVSDDGLEITDLTINFDLNSQRIDGQETMISFTSGECSGKEFKITYNHAKKTIRIEPITEQDGYVFPNKTFEIKEGDKYILYGYIMPQNYFDEAEEELRKKGIELLSKSADTKPPYGVEVDEKYMRDNGIIVNAGDRVRLRDTAMNIDEPIRVTSVEFPLVNPNKVNFVISDVVPLNYTEKAIIDIDRTKRDSVVISKVSAERSRQSMLNIDRLKGLVFDPDGYFDKDRIKPFSIETYMLSVGAKSQNFALSGVFIDANSGGDPNHVSISQGSLIHYQISIEGSGYIWQMAIAEFSALDPAKSYYLSAKCRKTALTGEWVLSDTPIKTEAETGFYHFNVGVVYPVADGQRGYDFTNGMTMILGDQITTGTIKSLDGLNFMNLSTGQFNLGSADSGMDYGISAPETLTIRGEIIANNAKFINLIVQNLRTKTSGRRIEISELKNNIQLIDADGNQILVIDDGVDFGFTETPMAGLRMINPLDGSLSYGTGNGFFSNGSGQQFLSGATGIETNASLVGLLWKRNTRPNGISAAVAGVDQTSSGDSKSYAGAFLGKTLLGGAISTFNSSNNEVNGVSSRISLMNSSGVSYHLTFVNGLMVEAGFGA